MERKSMSNKGNEEREGKRRKGRVTKRKRKNN